MFPSFGCLLFFSLYHGKLLLNSSRPVRTLTPHWLTGFQLRYDSGAWSIAYLCRTACKEFFVITLENSRESVTDKSKKSLARKVTMHQSI